MRDDALTTIGELLGATASAHSPRVLARAIAGVLGVERVELAATAPAGMKLLAPGIAVPASAALPAFCDEPPFRAVLGEVVAAASRHLEIVQRVARLSRRAHVENRELRADLERRAYAGELVARSAAMRAVVARAELVARHPTTVLVTGESGCGKEVLAREIHRRSPRAHRPLIQLNCGAIPDGLVESELFGHERGAFTGADRVHHGAFERAHRGTLFLDEVAELPLAAQAKLLRVLQERRIRRVGGAGEIDVDVRVIAATNRDLASLVERGAFRTDLFYRLHVFAIEIPPLRARRGDLGPLVAALVAELAHKLQLPVPTITKSELARLEAHDWPGNVRELANTLETALILGGGERLELPDHISRRASWRADDVRFESAVRGAIEEALRARRGKIYGRDGAAAYLGLKPATLQSKMRKLGIERRRFC